MSNAPAINLTDYDSEKLHIPIRADCGHAFPVPLARLEDGREFTCPVCGRIDNLDADAREAAKAEIAALRAQGKVDHLSSIVGSTIDKVERK